MSNKIGNIKHGGCGSLTYARWKSMMARCYQNNAANYQYYGAKGIGVCVQWHDYPVFLSDMGECLDKTMTLDRINNDKDYQPDNCRWETQAIQNKNRSYCVNLTHNGVTKILADWALEIGISANALAMRLRLGWTIERALTQPLKKRTAMAT